MRYIGDGAREYDLSDERDRSEYERIVRSAGFEIELDDEEMERLVG